jgi:hypothetical protein
MYVFINNQLVSFQNYFGFQSQRCQVKGYKMFPHTNLPHVQHVARELQVECDCSKELCACF